jgi:sulfite exporter TauE/SafE/copper chaperone CopZ
MDKIVVPIKGMHCRSCEITLTDKFESLASVRKAEVSLKSKTATLYGKNLPSEGTIEQIVESAGYGVGYEKKPWIAKNTAIYKDLALGAVLITIIGIALGSSGIADIVGTGNLNSEGIYMALVIGLTAGVSTCMALVGGLVLGLSAKHAEKHPTATASQKFRPHIFFNASRIVTFFVLGGLIGMLGSAFQLQGMALGLLTIAVGIVMLVLGLQLTNLFPRLSNGGLTLPSGIARRLGISKRQNREYSHKNAAMLGAISFFLPCGFTQAMQLYAISTGSFMTGALVMGLFAIGTSPGLLGVGALTSAFSGEKAKRFFRIVGVAVVVMAFVNLSNGFNLTGLQSTHGNFSAFKFGTTATNKDSASAEQPGDNASDYVLKAKYAVASGMIPKEFTIKANQSYLLEVEALEDGVGCMSTVLIPRLNNNVKYLVKGETLSLPFKVEGPGTYKITCAMGVPHATIKVVEG